MWITIISCIYNVENYILPCGNIDIDYGYSKGI